MTYQLMLYTNKLQFLDLIAQTRCWGILYLLNVKSKNSLKPTYAVSDGLIEFDECGTMAKLTTGLNALQDAFFEASKTTEDKLSDLINNTTGDSVPVSQLKEILANLNRNRNDNHNHNHIFDDDGDLSVHDMEELLDSDN